MNRAVNLPAILVGAILGVAVIGSLAASAVAVIGADAELPPQYHWEGGDFDRDLALTRRAAALGVAATLEISPGGSCRLQLSMRASPPAALQLSLVHATAAALDRTVLLTAQRAGYAGDCRGLTRAHYHLELADVPQSWSVREEVSDLSSRVTLAARAPAD